MNLRSLLPLLVLVLLVILFIATFSTNIFGESRPECSREMIAPMAKSHLQVLIGRNMWMAHCESSPALPGVDGAGYQFEQWRSNWSPDHVHLIR
jgi:hypothetical protein